MSQVCFYTDLLAVGDRGRRERMPACPGKSSTFGYEEAPEGEKQTRKSTVAVVCIILHTLNGVVITHRGCV